MHPVKHSGTGSHSINWCYGFLSGERKIVPPVPMFNTVDIKDLARIHILALDNEKAAEKQLFVLVAGACSAIS